MKLFSHVILLLSIALLITSCKSIPKGASDVSATWVFGQHYLPSSVTKSGSTESFDLTYKAPLGKRVAKKSLKAGVKVPIAIHMHGCKGIDDGDDAGQYRSLLLSQGYAVFMPNSFARPGRQVLCGKGGMYERIDTRLEEVRYALDQVQKLKWVNQKNIILTGFSEGGNTVDNWYTDEFAGQIILGSACTLTDDGSPAAPKNVPVLAIVGESDNYRPGLSCTITRKAKGSKSIVIPGADHWISHYDLTKNSIKSFLRQCCSIK